jgi:hypothetical protein
VFLHSKKIVKKQKKGDAMTRFWYTLKKLHPHAFSKSCQYATINGFSYISLWYVSIEVVQKDLQRCITWLKKSGKGRQEWKT